MYVFEQVVLINNFGVDGVDEDSHILLVLWVFERGSQVIIFNVHGHESRP